MDPVRSPVVVGRDEEIERLRSALGRLAEEQGGALFLVGGPGTGKSRLAEQAVTEASALSGGRRPLVLTGRAVSSPVPVPFRPLAEALQAGLRAVGDPPDLGPYRAALSRLLPQWAAERGSREPDAGPGGGPVSLVVLAEGVLRALRALSGGGPVLLVLEDLHWADAETLAVLEYLADNAAGERLLLLGTSRDSGRDALAVATALTARRRAELLTLEPLGPDAVARLVAACLGGDPDPSLVAAVVDRADGVPLFVEELLAVASAAGSIATAVPRTFQESVRDRLARLPADERRVVEAAAVIGRRIDCAWVAEATGSGLPLVLSALRAAAGAHLLESDTDGAPGRLRFRHALTRDAVLAETFAPERAARAAAALAALQARDPELGGDACQHAADLAEEAGAADDAVRLLLQAARRAAVAGAAATAEALLDRARRLVASDPQARVAVDELLLEVLAAAGRADRVPDVGRMLLARLDSRADPGRVARTHLRLAQAALDAADPALAGEHLQAARALLPDASDPELALRTDLVAADAALVQQRPDEAALLAERAAQAAGRLGLEAARCEARLLLGRCQRERDAAAADRTFALAVAEAERAGLAVLGVRALAEQASLDMQDALPPTRLVAAAEQAQAVGAMAVAGVALLHAAITSYLRFEREEALARAAELAVLAERYRLGLLRPAAGIVAACARAAGGEEEAMERLLAEHLPAVATDPVWVANCWGNARAVARLGADDRAGAVAALRQAVAVSRPALPGSNPFHGLCVLIDVVEGADPVTHPLWVDAPVPRPCRGLLAAARAVALGQAGDGEAAATAQADALDLLAPMPWYRHVAARLVAERAVADGWGSPEVWLRETDSWATSVGLPRLADASRGLLRRAGARVPRQGAAAGLPPELRRLGITSREADVLELVARGASNRDVAARLFLSPRTVEKHVERLLQKTGCASRTELAVRAVALRAAGAGRPA